MWFREIICYKVGGGKQGTSSILGVKEDVRERDSCSLTSRYST